ncbi:hypothetical protein CYMTET_52946 [Cymbomonas tetramitiformis]|uniref:Uncharacterized protein n=1 Tax=Cymbomonas tetramitiformis TaxID=36881 RepID=A0AAE0ER38_9CHLO|nr:hypothetical protein CYMTET_52946 [Cymbomonas tetramitiformis]
MVAKRNGFEHFNCYGVRRCPCGSLIRGRSGKDARHPIPVISRLLQSCWILPSCTLEKYSIVTLWACQGTVRLSIRGRPSSVTKTVLKPTHIITQSVFRHACRQLLKPVSGIHSWRVPTTVGQLVVAVM